MSNAERAERQPHSSRGEEIQSHLSSSVGHRQDSSAIFRMESQNKNGNASFDREMCAGGAVRMRAATHVDPVCAAWEKSLSEDALIVTLEDPHPAPRFMHLMTARRTC